MRKKSRKAMRSALLYASVTGEVVGSGAGRRVIYSEVWNHGTKQFSAL